MRSSLPVFESAIACFLRDGVAYSTCKTTCPPPILSVMLQRKRVRAVKKNMTRQKAMRIGSCLVRRNRSRHSHGKKQQSLRACQTATTMMTTRTRRHLVPDGLARLLFDLSRTHSPIRPPICTVVLPALRSLNIHMRHGHSCLNALRLVHPEDHTPRLRLIMLTMTRLSAPRSPLFCRVPMQPASVRRKLSSVTPASSLHLHSPWE
jgi:hypothetical protein